MPFIECPKCGYKLKYEAEHVGKKGRCKQCSNLFILPPIPESDEMERQLKGETPPYQGTGTESPKLLVPGRPEIKQLVPVLCEHCSKSYQVFGAMGTSFQCEQCQKKTCVALLDVSRIPGPHGPGEPGCVPTFRGHPEHYRAAYEAGSRPRQYRQKLIDDGVLQGLIFRMMLDASFAVKGQFEGGLKLSGANLQGAYFFSAYRAFESADLSEAILDGSNWVMTSLKDANLQGASLRGCCIESRSDLSGASFQNADLSQARLILETYLQNGASDFRAANLENALIHVSGPVNEGMFNFKKAHMKGCKISSNLLPVLSERQRAEVEVMPSEDELLKADQKIAAERDRRFRSIPILAKRSQKLDHGPNAGSTTVHQTSYAIDDVREHVLSNHLSRHLLNWSWPLAGVITASAVFVVTAIGNAGFSWDRDWMLTFPLYAGPAGAIGFLVALTGSRHLYKKVASADRGWTVGEKHPELHIVYEHEWRKFRSNLR